MPLDPQAQQFLNVINHSNQQPFHKIGAVKAREIYDTRPTDLSPQWIEVFKVEDKTAHINSLSIPLRLYTPIFSEQALPVLVFYHGGGMVIGSLEGYDSLCRQIAVQSECIVVSVDYRLAPENKFPAAVDDAYYALSWVVKHSESFNGDSHCIMVGGDSAGGSLAAVVAILARDASLVNLKGQVLIYPATAPHADSSSHSRFAEGYFLERPTILWFHESYIRSDQDRHDFRYAPLIADHLDGLPPAFVIVADHDPLRDEGVAYAERLKQSGVDVVLQEYYGMFHPFVSFAGVLDQGKLAITACAKAIRKFYRE